MASAAEAGGREAARPVWSPARKRVVQWVAVAGLATVLAGHSALAQWQETHAFVVNASDSLPNWAFFIHDDKSPDRGDYVFFTPPASPLLAAHFGKETGPFGKRALGMPGDAVTHDGPLVRVNGVVVGRMKPLTKAGEPLTPGPTGRVPEGCYYMGTPHPDGFDSRYAEIGFICSNSIIGTGVPIL